MYSMAESFAMSAPFGYLATPGFPLHYPHDTNTTCLVSALHSGHEVEVSVVHLSLPLGDDCEDHLDITREKAVSRICSYETHGRFRAPAVLISFTSDSIHSAAGVWLHFRGERVMLMSFTFAYHGYLSDLTLQVCKGVMLELSARGVRTRCLHRLQWKSVAKFFTLIVQEVA